MKASRNCYFKSNFAYFLGKVKKFLKKICEVATNLIVDSPLITSNWYVPNMGEPFSCLNLMFTNHITWDFAELCGLRGLTFVPKLTHITCSTAGRKYFYLLFTNILWVEGNEIGMSINGKKNENIEMLETFCFNNKKSKILENQ